MRVSDIMTGEPVCCTPDTKLPEAAQLMCDHDCGEIPVIDSETSRRPVGVVTDRDIACRIVAKGSDARSASVRECMSSPCITVHPDMDLEECCRLLEERQIRRVPVVDEDGRCVGIVSQADIAIHAPEWETAELVREVSEKTRFI